MSQKPKKGGYLKEAKDSEINKLKRRIRKLEKEKAALKSELKTYDDAFGQTVDFLKEFTDEFSLEDVIKMAKENKKAKESKRICEKCGSDNIKVIPSLAGDIIICSDCKFRKIEKNGSKI